MTAVVVTAVGRFCRRKNGQLRCFFPLSILSFTLLQTAFALANTNNILLLLLFFCFPRLMILPCFSFLQGALCVGSNSPSRKGTKVKVEAENRNGNWLGRITSFFTPAFGEYHAFFQGKNTYSACCYYPSLSPPPPFGHQFYPLPLPRAAFAYALAPLPPRPFYGLSLSLFSFSFPSLPHCSLSP